MDACDPQNLVAAATCFDQVIPPGMQAAVQTYLLAKLAGGSVDPSTLLQEAACFQSLSPAAQAEVQTFLLCQIANQ